MFRYRTFYVIGEVAFMCQFISNPFDAVCRESAFPSFILKFASSNLYRTSFDFVIYSSRFCVLQWGYHHWKQMCLRYLRGINSWFVGIPLTSFFNVFLLCFAFFMSALYWIIGLTCFWAPRNFACTVESAYFVSLGIEWNSTKYEKWELLAALLWSSRNGDLCN